MATVVAADFPPKKTTILGTPVELDYSDINDTILTKLGLQNVPPEDKQKIMREFYVTPPDSTHTLSLQGYPATQAIVKSLLIDLIQDQQPSITINKVAAVRDTSIPVAYHMKARGISLSIELPHYLVNYDSGLIVEAKKINNGITKSTTQVKQSGNTSKPVTLSGNVGQLVKPINSANKSARSKNNQRVDDAEEKYAEGSLINQQERASKIVAIATSILARNRMNTKRLQILAENPVEVPIKSLKIPEIDKIFDPLFEEAQKIKNTNKNNKYVELILLHNKIIHEFEKILYRTNERISTYFYYKL